MLLNSEQKDLFVFLQYVCVMYGFFPPENTLRNTKTAL